MLNFERIVLAALALAPLPLNAQGKLWIVGDPPCPKTHLRNRADKLPLRDARASRG